MKYLIVKPSPLPVIIPAVPIYSPQDPVFRLYGIMEGEPV